MPDSFEYQTRSEFVNRVQQTNPQYRNMTEEEAYDLYTERMPEYKTQIAENYQQAGQVTEGAVMPTADEKDFFDGLSDIFSKDFYKFVPFVRDAELFEVGKLLHISNKMEDGRASDSEISELKEWLAEEERPTSWGYNTLMIVANALPFMTEIGVGIGLAATGAGLPGAAGVIGRSGAVKVGKEALEAGAKKAVKGAVKKRTISATAKTVREMAEKKAKRLAAKAATTKVGQGIKASGAKVAGKTAAGRAKVAAGYQIGKEGVESGLKHGMKNTGAREFSKRLASAGRLTKNGNLKAFMDRASREAGEGAIRGGAKQIAGTVGVGAEEAAMMAMFRFPQGLITMTEHMLPEMKLSEGLDHDVVIEVLDDGDDWLPALVKGYADLGIEFFTENVGKSLTIAGGVWSREVVKKMGPTFKAAGEVAAKTTKIGGVAEDLNNRQWVTALKASVINNWKKVKPSAEIVEKLRTIGYDGVLEEMWEERVGDVMRASVGLQGHWLPSPEQLASEAVAFAIFGAGASAAGRASESTILGGAGYGAAKEIRELMNISKNAEERVLLQSEVDRKLRKILDRQKAEQENPSKLVALLRKISVKGFQPFANLQQAGSVDQYLAMTHGTTLTAKMAQSYGKENNDEEAMRAGRRYLEGVMLNSGLYKVGSEKEGLNAVMKIREGTMKLRRSDGMTMSHYVVSPEGWTEENLNQQGILVPTVEEYNKLDSQGLLSGVDIDLHELAGAPTGSPAAQKNMDIVAQMFHYTSLEDAAAHYEFLHVMAKSVTGMEKNLDIDLEFKKMPAVVVRDTGENIRLLGYRAPNGKGVYAMAINARNNGESGQVFLSPFARIEDTFEDLLETTLAQLTFSGNDLALSIDEMANSIRSQIKNIDGLEEYGDHEVVSKGIMAGVLGIYRGTDAALWEQINFSEHQVKVFNDYLNTIFGSELIDMVTRRAVASEAVEAGDSAAVEKAVEGTKERTAQADRESEKKPDQVIEEPDKTPPAQSSGGMEAMQEFVEGKLTPDQLSERLVAAASVPLIAADAKALASINVVISELNTNSNLTALQTTVRNALTHFRSSGYSFSADAVEIGPESSEADVMKALTVAQLTDIGRHLTMESEFTKNALSKTLARNLGSEDLALDFLYDTIKADVADGGTLTKIVNRSTLTEEDKARTIDLFNSWLLTRESTPDLERLRQALNDMVKYNDDPMLPTRMDKVGAAFDVMKSAHRRNENSFRIPAIGVVSTDSGQKLNYLNQNTNIEQVARTLMGTMDVRIAMAGGIESFTKRFKALHENGNRDTKARALGNVTGLTQLFFNARSENKINEIFKAFTNHLENAVTEGFTTDEINTYAASFFLNHSLKGDSAPVLKMLLSFGGSASALKIRFKNSEGNQELALRQTSQLTDAAASIAALHGIPRERAMALLSGVSTEIRRRNARDMHGSEREDILFEVYDNGRFEIDGQKYYWQSSGQMGAKNQIYTYAMPYYTENELEAKVAEYAPTQEQIPVNVVKDLFKQVKSTSGDLERRRLKFELHHIINMPVLDQHIHGEDNSYVDDNGKFDPVSRLKRGSNVPTGGLAWRGKKIRYIVVNDPMIGDTHQSYFDGQVFFAGHLGREFADYMGSMFMRGHNDAASIKPNVSYVENGKRTLIKGAWKNTRLYAELDGYAELNRWLEDYNEGKAPEDRIDAIIPSSSFKVGIPENVINAFNEDGSTNEELLYDMPNPETHILSGENFVAVQNLDYDNNPALANEAKQKNSDLIHGVNAEDVSRLANLNTAIQASLMEESAVDVIFSRSRTAILEAFHEGKNDIGKFQQENLTAYEAIEKLISILAPELAIEEEVELEGENIRRYTAEASSLMIDTLKKLTWIEEADAAYFDSLYRAIENDHSEHDPAIIKPIQAMKGRFLQKMITRRLNRAMMLKSSAGAIDIPDAKLTADGKHTILPWIISNTPGVRVAEWHKDWASVERAVKDRVQYEDLYINNEFHAWEVREYEEAWKFRDANGKLREGGFVIPGGLIMESRIPGENMQSHVPHRLWKPVNAGYVGNISISPRDVVMRKGEDFDGDMGYQYTMIPNAITTIDKNRNEMFKHQVKSFTLGSYYDALTATVDAKIFDGIAKKYQLSDADKRARMIYTNTVQGENWDSEVNSAAFDSLSIIAANIKFYDIAHALEFNTKLDTVIHLPMGLKIDFSKEALKNLNQNKPVITERKRFYGTALINITVDDLTHQQMHALGINEVTAPIVQALLALDTTVGADAKNSEEMTKAFVAQMDKIVEYMHSDSIRAYVAAKREMDGVNFSSYSYKPTGKYKGKDGKTRRPTQKEIMKELMRKHSTGELSEKYDLNPILRLESVVDEITTVAQIMNDMYDAPDSQGEFVLREQGLALLQENTLREFDVSGAMVEVDGVKRLHDHLLPLRTSLDMMEGRAFNNSALLSNPGRLLMQQIFSSEENQHLADSKMFLDHMQKTLYRGLAVRSMSFRGDVSFAKLGAFIASEISEHSKNNPNSALSKLIGFEEYEGLVTVKMNDAYQRGVIDPHLIAQAWEEFDSFDAETKQAFALYAFSVYGTHDTAFGGSIAPVLSESYRKDMSHLFEAMISDFNNGTIGGETGQQDFITEIAKQIMQTWKHARTGKQSKYMPIHSVDERLNDVLQFEYQDTKVSQVLLQELSAHTDTTFVDYIPEGLLGGATRAMMDAARASATGIIDADIRQLSIDNYRVEQMKRHGIAVPTDSGVSLNDNASVEGSSAQADRMNNHSLVSYATAITRLSPSMMAGAPGAHLMFFKHTNKTEAERIIGRLERERYEEAVGLRQIRKAGKLTDHDKARGRDVLAAMVSKLSGQTKVIVEHDIVEMSVDEAIEHIWNLEQNNYTPKSLQQGLSVPQKRKLVSIRKKDTFTVPPADTQADYHKIILQDQLVDYLAREELKKVPVKVANFHENTADEILADYDAHRLTDNEDGNPNSWKMPSAQLLSELRDGFEKARIRSNSDTSVRTKLIQKRANYVPMYLSKNTYAETTAEERSYVVESSGRAEARNDSDQDYVTAVAKGMIPETTNAAELYERWTRDIANDKQVAGAWQILLMASLPDGSPMIVPHFNVQEYKDGKSAIPMDLIEAFAQKLSLSLHKEIPANQTAMDFINDNQPTALDDFTKFETGVESMPTVWARNDQTRNIVKKIVGYRKTGPLWKVWEGLNAWTKFMAVGFPYASYFHWTALVESQVASGGLKGSSAWTPVQSYKDFQKFIGQAKANPEMLRRWIEAGLKVSLENPDYAQGIVNADLRKMSDIAKRNKHHGIAKSIDRFIQIKGDWDKKLWVDFHAPLKLWTAEGLLSNARTQADIDKSPFDEFDAMTQISPYVDTLYGGINDNRAIWKTPATVQVINNTLFARDWSEAALGSAGAGNIPGLEEVFGRQTAMMNKIRYGTYWPAFVGIVMFGIPQAIQAGIYAMAMPFGGDDDDLADRVFDNVPFTFLNEHDRKTWIDVTPALEMLPFYSGGKTGARKIFLRWGKQGYEIGNWLKEPVRSLGHKTSIPIKFAYEQLMGRSVGGWDMAYKDADFFGVLQAQGSFWNSRVGDATTKFMPFTAQDIVKGKPTAWIAKAKSGKHGWYASKQLSELYLGYVNAKNWSVTKNHEKNILIMGNDIVRAAAANGFDPDKVQKDALQNARAELYIQFEEAMAKNQQGKALAIGERLMALEGSAKKINLKLRGVKQAYSQ